MKAYSDARERLVRHTQCILGAMVLSVYIVEIATEVCICCFSRCTLQRIIGHVISCHAQNNFLVAFILEPPNPYPYDVRATRFGNIFWEDLLLF